MNVELISWTKDPIGTIARAAATCYKSKPSVKTVRGCIESGHWSVLEFTNFVFKIEGIDRSCYDRKTEVLTKDGWKYFCDVKVGEEVLTINQKTLQAEF